jgi:hypothetical protein
MEELLTRFFENLVGRVHGPMVFRFLLQPAVATFLAFKDGKKDAHEGRGPYFWGLFTEPLHRRERLLSGWKSVGKVFILALVLDGVYQFIVVRWFYPVEALVTAILLAFVPYLLFRGLFTRVLRKK